MSKAIIYGSSTGNTQSVAEMLGEALGIDNVLDVAEISPEDLNEYDKLILGTSTWGEGEPQDDWDAFDWSDVDLSGKTVALFGLGDQESYADTYCDASALLYDEVKAKGATVVGAWENDGYDFEESKFIGEDGKFLGLALDSDNQDDLNEERVAKWVESIKADFS